MDEASTFQDSIEDGSCQVVVVQHFSPLTEGFVGSKDHRAFFEIAIIHHMEQNIGGFGAIAEIPDFIDHDDVRTSVGGQRLVQKAFGAGVRQILDELGGGGTKSLEAILDGAIANGHGEMSFTAALLAVEDQGAALGDEVRSQIGTEQRLPQSRLQSEIELINGFEERKVSLSGAALQASLLAVRHFFGQQKSEKVAIRPVLFLGSIHHLLVGAACVRQV